MEQLIVAGLGNPGEQYQQTRHNLGAHLVELLSLKDISDFSIHKNSQCLYHQSVEFDRKIHFVLPQGFMNLSGYCLVRYAQYFKVPFDSILICFDDLSLPCGQFRLKTSGGDGGHRGMKDCLNHLTGVNLLRLRLGIGHPGTKEDVQHYVLRPFTKEQGIEVQSSLSTLIEHRHVLLKSQWSFFQNLLH